MEGTCSTSVTLAYYGSASVNNTGGRGGSNRRQRRSEVIKSNLGDEPRLSEATRNWRIFTGW